MAGQSDQAALGMDLLREQTGAQEAAFLQAATAALGLGDTQSPAGPLLAEADPFSLALLSRQGGQVVCG